MFDVFWGIILAFGFIYLVGNFNKFSPSVRALIGFIIGVSFAIYTLKSFT
jgi:hypothetical protein